jgi:putative component of membrane protein insertase Oxa1/YidC/SpoIIIJ protein YidD
LKWFERDPVLGDRAFSGIRFFFRSEKVSSIPTLLWTIGIKMWLRMLEQNSVLFLLLLSSVFFSLAQARRVSQLRAQKLFLCVNMLRGVRADTCYHYNYPFLAREGMLLAAWFVSWRALRWRPPYFGGDVNYLIHGVSPLHDQ